MSADFIAWKNCEVQRSLDLEGFLDGLQQLRLKKSAETELTTEKLVTTKIRLKSNVSGTTETTYAVLSARCLAFLNSVRGCKLCPHASDVAVGCARSVSYPLDAAFEEALFAYFSRELRDEKSPSRWLLENFVANVPSSSEWHERRGNVKNSLAVLSKPLTISCLVNEEVISVDSAQLLDTLFSSTSAEDLPWIGAFWRGFLEFGEPAQTADAVLEMTFIATDLAKLESFEVNADPRSLRSKSAAEMSPTMREMHSVAQMCIVHVESGATEDDLPLYVSP